MRFLNLSSLRPIQIPKIMKINAELKVEKKLPVLLKGKKFMKTLKIMAK